MRTGEPLRLHVLDVGQGDSLILEFPGGESFAIIDCNRHPQSNRGFGIEYDPAEPKALSFFRKKHEEGARPRIAFALQTHPHIDHFRGFAQLIEGLQELEIPIEQFWDFGMSIPKAKEMAAEGPDDPNLRGNAREFAKLCDLQAQLVGAGTRYEPITKPQRRIWEEHGITIDAIAPDAMHASAYLAYMLAFNDKAKRDRLKGLCSDADNDNIISSALLITYGETRLLLGGDLTNLAWEIIGEREDLDPRCDVFKVSHHGFGAGNFPNDVPLWPTLVRDRKKLIAVISGGYRKDISLVRTIGGPREEGHEVYCTGPIPPPRERDYEPPVPLDPIARETMRQDRLRSEDDRDEDDVPQGAEGDPPVGHGNVVVLCYPDGTCRTETEFPGFVPSSPR